MTRTNVHPFGILKTPVDIVFDALFNCSYNAGRSVSQYMFCKCGHICGPKGCPDMICSVFQVKFHNQNEGLPLKAQNQIQQTTKVKKE